MKNWILSVFSPILCLLPVFLLTKRPSFTHPFTKISPSEELGTLPERVTVLVESPSTWCVGNFKLECKALLQLCAVISQYTIAQCSRWMKMEKGERLDKGTNLKPQVQRTVTAVNPILKITMCCHTSVTHISRTVAAFLTNSKTSDLGWSWWVFEEGPGARLPTPEHCGKAKNDCWKGVNFIFGNPPERWKKISLRDCSPIFPCRRSWWKLMSAGCRNR